MALPPSFAGAVQAAGASGTVGGVPPKTRTNTSRSPLVSPVTRFEAVEPNATTAPPAEPDGPKLDEFPCAPTVETLSRTVTPAGSCANTSSCPFVSPATRSEAFDANAAKLPSPATATCSLRPFPLVPDVFTLSSRVGPIETRSNTSQVPFASLLTSSSVHPTNAITLPSSLIDASAPPSAASPPPSASLTRVVDGVWRSRRYTSIFPLPSEGSSGAAVLNTTYWPSALTGEDPWVPSTCPSSPLVPTLTRSVLLP